MPPRSQTNRTHWTLVHHIFMRATAESLSASQHQNQHSSKLTCVHNFSWGLFCLQLNAAKSSVGFKSLSTQSIFHSVSVFSRWWGFHNIIHKSQSRGGGLMNQPLMLPRTKSRLSMKASASAKNKMITNFNEKKYNNLECWRNHIPGHFEFILKAFQWKFSTVRPPPTQKNRLKNEKRFWFNF